MTARKTTAAGDKFHDIEVELVPPKKPLRTKIGTRTIVIPPPTRSVFRELAKAPDDAILDDISEILLADQKDELLEFFEDKYETWLDFSAKMRAHFFGPGSDDVEGKSQDSSDS